jgi:bacterioferritin-associated ferredoxin
MYVCVCNGYREREVREAALQGACSVDEAYAFLGAEPCCGSCIPCAEDIIDETRRAIVGHTAPHLRSVAE